MYDIILYVPAQALLSAADDGGERLLVDHLSLHEEHLLRPNESMRETRPENVQGTSVPSHQCIALKTVCSTAIVYSHRVGHTVYNIVPAYARM
jgi:hypothetical protein